MKKKSIVGALTFIVISLLTTFVSAAPESFFGNQIIQEKLLRL